MDDDTREQFHRIEIRLERLETRIDQMDKRMGDGVGQLNARFEGLESRIARKADTWIVGLFGTLMVLLMTIYKFWQ